MTLWKRLLLLSLGDAAQVNRATLTGIVTDPTGAVAPAVKVSAVHVETGTSSSTESTGAGVYTLRSLQIGTYRVEYEAAGFKKAVRDQVLLTAGSTMRLDVALGVRSVTESVMILAQATPIETESTRVATNVTTKLVQDLPLLVDGGIRSIFTLARIAPETRGTGQNFRQNAQYPRVHDDLRATFQLRAPEAKKVQVRVVTTNYDMTRAEDGTWSVTTPPLVVGFHYYNFIIDGVTVADPASETFYGMSRQSSGIEIPEKGVDITR